MKTFAAIGILAAAILMASGQAQAAGWGDVGIQPMNSCNRYTHNFNASKYTELLTEFRRVAGLRPSVENVRYMMAIKSRMDGIAAIARACGRLPGVPV
ncbi:MAG: hypothetical protein MO847_10450 [Candidatus Protistobacter heckmanni]|nr:hypothetical protein [Candidatus Protistobacter heckmanni]